MPKIKIEGQNKLTGKIKISGAKNSAVALLPAAILSKNKTIIYNVPKISDIKYLIDILKLLGCIVEEKNKNIYIDSTNLKNKAIPSELSQEMRASYYFMGALLARFGYVKIAFPGGCKIGNRPIDLHIKGFEQLGAKVTIKKNVYTIEAKELIGTNIYLNIASVGATINLMLAATNAKGKTIIENAAREPEIVNMASLLINMGAKIEGAGTSKITIYGQKELKNGVVEVFPDRIEAITYLIIGALIGEKIKLVNIIPEHIEAVLTKLTDVGVKYEIEKDTITISKPKKYKVTDIITAVYPGFPTDAQQTFTTLLTQADGSSKITETIYESRFKSTEQLNKMGANTNYSENILVIHGPTKLYGANVEATDLRGGAALLAAALIAEGTTTIDNIHYILRGYEDVIEKLQNVGAKIEIIE